MPRQKKFPGVKCDVRLLIYSPAEIVEAYRRARLALGAQVVDGEIYKTVLRLSKATNQNEEVTGEHQKHISS